MWMTRTSLALACAAGLCCAPSPDAAPESPASPQAYSIIDALRVELVDAHGRGDADAIATMMVADATLSLPGGRQAAGRSAVRQVYVDLFAEYRVELELVAADSRIVDGSSARETGAYRLVLTTRQGGTRSEFRGDYQLAGVLGEGGLRLTTLTLAHEPS